MSALLLISLSLLAIEPGEMRRPVSIVDAMKLAAQNNADYQAALSQVALAQAQAFRGYGVIMPDVNVGAQYVHTTAPASFDVGSFITGVGQIYGLGMPLAPAPGAVEIIGANSVYGTGQVTQVLFSPQFFLLSASKPGVDAAKLGAMEAREQILLAVAKVYLGLQGLEQIEKAAHDAETLSLKHERDVSAQVSLGTAVEVALLRARADTAQARTTIAQLQGTRLGLLATLEQLTGEAIEPIEGGAALPIPSQQAASEEPWTNTYLVRSGEQFEKVLDTFVFSDRLLWLPTLAAFLKGQYNSNSGFTGRNWSADVGVSISFPIFDRGQRYATLWEDEAKLAGQRAKVRGDRQKARATWESARANLVSSQVALEQADAQAELAGRAQKQADGAFQLGLSTALELSDIDNKAFFARSQAAQARAQLEIRKVEMVAAEGRIAKVLGLEELR